MSHWLVEIGTNMEYLDYLEYLEYLEYLKPIYVEAWLDHLAN